MKKTAAAQKLREERLEARVTPEFKSQLLLAASLEGQSITDFVVKHLGNAARQVIQQQTEWQLSQADSVAFVEALLHPKPAGERLQQAAQRYRAVTGH